MSEKKLVLDDGEYQFLDKLVDLVQVQGAEVDLLAGLRAKLRKLKQ